MLEDELLPNTRIEMNFEIEPDGNLIWQAGADCRVVITFSVSTDPRTLSNCHLEVGNGNEYPEIQYTPTTDMTNEYGEGSLLNKSNFSTLFPFLYFDLTKPKMDIKDGTTKLTFKYELSGTTAAAYSIYALTLYKQDVELIQKDGKIILLS